MPTPDDERLRQLRAESLEDFFENGALGLHLVAGDGTILRANRAELELLGYAPDEYIGRPIADFHADAATIADILARLSRGETLNQYPARLKAKDGSIKHVLISSSVCFDQEGEFLNTRCFTLDVTEKRLAEEELRRAQQRLSATYEHAFAAISETDENGRFLRVNDAFPELTGYSKEELLARTVFDITHPDDVGADRDQYASQVRGDFDRYSIEKRYLRSDGTVVWVKVMSSSVRHEDGGFVHGVRVVHNVTEERMAAERNRLLIDELNHRVKNSLATVQSLASQTARNACDIDDFMRRFEGRLVALSNAHDRLTRRNWEGASLSEIAHEELALHGGRNRGLAASGPDVALPPRVALSLSMAFHELGTNAAKYGSLRSPSGSIAVDWTLERDIHSRPSRVNLSWLERGGPEVQAPNSNGFGSRLLEAMAMEVGGEAAMAFKPEGFEWRISFPIPRQGWDDAPMATASSAASSSAAPG